MATEVLLLGNLNFVQFTTTAMVAGVMILDLIDFFEDFFEL